MSIYSDALADLQGVLSHGGELTFLQKMNLLACVRGSSSVTTASRTAMSTGATAMATGATAVVTGKNAVITANTGVAVQTLILAGIGGASATAGTAIDALMATLMTANGVLTTAGTTLGTAGTALTAALPTANALTTNAVMDGSL